MRPDPRGPVVSVTVTQFPVVNHAAVLRNSPPATEDTSSPGVVPGVGGSDPERCGATELVAPVLSYRRRPSLAMIVR